MARLTIKQYEDYMKAAPRTWGYGAFLVYDRQKANLLLMQEHILRAEKEAWIEPVSGEETSNNGKIFRMTDIAFGAPVLSFENSNISSSKAALTMPVLSGKLTEWVREPGAELPTLVGITHMDPLTAPRVKMNIFLKEGGEGVVDKEGRVYLDLAESSAYSFEVSQWPDLNTKLGALIEEKFKDPARGEQVWELSKLAPIEGSLNPTSFRVRTHSLGRAGTTVASTNQADLEEGAVIVGVEFNDGKGGNFPENDGDMPYLLPERESGGPYSLNVLLSNETLVKNILNSLLDGLSGTGYVSSDVQYEKNDKGFYVGAVAGGIWYDRVYQILDEVDIEIRVTVAGELGNLKFSFESGRIGCEWAFNGLIEDGFFGRIRVNGQWHTARGSLELNIRAACSFALSMEDTVVTLTKGEVSVDGSWRAGELSGEYAEAFNRNFAYFKSDVEHTVAGVFDALAGDLKVVDLLRLNGLLFRNGQRSVGETFVQVGDISMLGELAPTLTAFAITPIEQSLIAGGTQALTLTPKLEPGATVEWEVNALPDDPEKPVGKDKLGEVVNGVYKAPKAETITGRFRQVIITATVGDSSSNALFTIVPKAVAVKPYLQNAFYSTPGQTERYVLEGGSVDSALTWAKSAGFKGELRDPTPDEYKEWSLSKDKAYKIYVAPTLNPDSGQVLGALMQLDQVLVTGAGITETIDITVVWVPTNATPKVTLQGGALKLVLNVPGGWGQPPEDLPPARTKWFVAKGKGRLDEVAGTYTPAANEDEHVIIAGVGLNPGTPQWNYTVLPMPYTSAEATIVYEVNQSIKGTVARAAYTDEQVKAMEAVEKAFSSPSASRT